MASKSGGTMANLTKALSLNDPKIVKAVGEYVAATTEAFRKAATLSPAVMAATGENIDAMEVSIASILADDKADRVAMIEKSITEFKAATEVEIAKAKTPEPTSAPTGGTGESEVVKSLQGQVGTLQQQLTAMQSSAAKEQALAKARLLLPNGGPVQEVADFLVGADAKSTAMITGLINAVAAQRAEGGTDIFKALGVAAPNSTPEESVLVKVAKAKADDESKKSGRRAA